MPNTPSVAEGETVGKVQDSQIFEPEAGNAVKVSKAGVQGELPQVGGSNSAICA
jgi:hypothetical protein